MMKNNTIRTRWAAIGAAVAVTLGAGGIGLVSATSPADAVAYVPIEPCRIADTRADPAFNIGPRSTPIGADEIHVIAAHGDNGDCTGIPTSATGLQLNVTALNASQNTFVTVWGDGVRPNASSLNPSLGQPPAPNAVTTGLTVTGRFNVFNRFGNVDVIADVVGYYTDHNHDDRYYTETEIDAALLAKANTADVYTRAEIDARRPMAISARTDQLLNLAAANQTVTSFSLTPNVDGSLVVSSSATVFEATEDQGVECSISTSAAFDSQYGQKWVSPGTDANVASQLSGTREVAVTAGVETTIGLVCHQTGGGTANLFDVSLTGVFVAQS